MRVDRAQTRSNLAVSTRTCKFLFTLLTLTLLTENTMATVSELVNRMTLSEPEFYLPPELWELIFAHLAGKRVLVMRLVCHRWKTIVDRKRSLWDTLSLCVRCSTMYERFRPESLPPVTGFRMNWGTIEDVDSWWPSFGESLTRINLPTFLAGSKNLQKLSLDSCVLESLLELFTTLVALPSLRHLELKNLRMLNNDFNISTFQLTTNLESLHLNNCNSLTNAMVTRLATSSCRMKEVRLYRMPQVNDATIRNMCVKLPRLKKLALLICSVMITSAEYIVEHAHSLEYLELDGCFEFRQAMEQLLKGHHRYIECKFH
ncbi:hypothetical protein pipiens_007010 [Culex pipiens pipiens]|uniref:F-box domain-containing protein n=1 Tax=Culex pipiens pipiens TaxID=38569 RepID=A0ABD1DN68_CULPP